MVNNLDHADAIRKAMEALERSVAKAFPLDELQAPDATGSSEVEKFRKDLGQKIKLARINLGFSRYELARRSGVQEKQLKKLESGSLKITVDSLYLTLKALGMSISIKKEK